MDWSNRVTLEQDKECLHQQSGQLCGKALSRVNRSLGDFSLADGDLCTAPKPVWRMKF